jgi:hypothetical protein
VLEESPDNSIAPFIYRIQELDGGFFEKFGTLLKEQHAQQDTAEMAPVCEEEESGNVELELDVPAEAGVVGMALQDSDSEPEESDKHEFITDAIGWNVSPVLLANTNYTK